MPNLSFISISSGLSPFSSFHSKEWIRVPNIKGNILIAKGNPGHTLRPPPNGINSKLLPLTSTSDPMNLSGLNNSWSSHMSLSLPIAHVLTKICAPFGIVKPLILTSLSALRGSNNGTAGCNRNVSFSNRETSDSLTGFPFPMIWSSSALALDRDSGLRSSSAIAHWKVVAVVSVPATNIL
ncbi:hypothetical protein G4B88_014433 [Cannabis sativa]|uniref:Uncharacterized protein n=1 Tax=Cannabis sativa TaxID=3483 RepID=A0A7J6I8W5_CANSA|nr:hypothetical protein G4B88_014433 [Cannabis sativa]